MFRTEAFCCLTKEFWVIFAFSYKEVVADVEVVDELMAIFSLAVADSESKCKFCKSSDMGESSSCFLMTWSIAFELALLEVAVVVVVILCLILFKAISSVLPVEVVGGVLGVGVVDNLNGCFSVTPFADVFVEADKSSISWPDSLEGNLNCLRLLLAFSVANPFVVATGAFVVAVTVAATDVDAATVVEVVFSIFISVKFVGLT